MEGDIGRIEKFEPQIPIQKLCVFNLSGDYDCLIWCFNYTRSYLNSSLAFNLPESPPMLPSLLQNQIAAEQTSQGVFCPPTVNCSVPSTICYSDGSQLFRSSFGVDEMAIQGRSLHKPPAISKKLKLRASAPPFCCTIDERKLKYQVIDSSIPKTHMEREAMLHTTNICSANDNLSDKHTNLLQIGEGSGGLPVESSLETQLIDVPCKLSNSFILSLEDFPLLPCKKEAISACDDFGSSCIDRSVEDPHQQTKESPPVAEPRAKLGDGTGTSGSTLAVLVLERIDDPKIGYLHNSEEKMLDRDDGDKIMSVVWPFSIDDEKEFPPLQR